MPKTKRQPVERKSVQIPKPLIDMVDDLVKRHPEIAPNRQQFVESAVREKVVNIQVMEQGMKRA